MTTTKNSKRFVAGLVAATAASLCCITPLLAILGGASGLASSFSWIEPLRPYFMGLTILVFAFAWYQKLKQVDCSCEAANKNKFTQSKTFLGIATVVAGLLVALPFYAKAFYPKAKQQQIVINSKKDIKLAMFKIKGMTCEGCTNPVNSEIAKVNGVIKYQTSFEKANSMVTFDNSKTSIGRIAAAINSTGYKVVYQKVTDN